MSERAPKSTPSASLNVRVSGALRAHVEACTTEGDFENVSEYIRDLIRKDKAEKDARAMDRVKAELQAAFSVGDDDFETVAADDIRERVRRRGRP